jgi:hypothetical protein
LPRGKVTCCRVKGALPSEKVSVSRVIAPLTREKAPLSSGKATVQDEKATFSNESVAYPLGKVPC